jgi:hypothetical protein
MCIEICRTTDRPPFFDAKIKLILDTFRTPKRVCSQFPFPRLGFSPSTGSGASRLAAPTRRQKDVDHAVDPLIVTAFAASSTTAFPFHTKYSSQAWEMGTGNNPVSVCERCLFNDPASAATPNGLMYSVLCTLCSIEEFSSIAWLYICADTEDSEAAKESRKGIQGSTSKTRPASVE